MSTGSGHYPFQSVWLATASAGEGCCLTFCPRIGHYPAATTKERASARPLELVRESGGVSLALFISFEGVEGSGKTTQTEMLHSYFVSRMVSVVKTREPGGTAIGDRIRYVLLEPGNAPFSPQAELLLYMAARSQLVKEVIEPALGSDVVVICDRYMDSSIAYQGYGRGLDLELIESLNRTVTNGCVPDMTVLLDVDPEIGLGRISSKLLPSAIWRSGGKDRLEQESLEFHRRVRQGYLNLARQHPERFFVLDARESKEKVHKAVVQELKRRHRDFFKAHQIRTRGGRSAPSG